MKRIIIVFFAIQTVCLSYSQDVPFHMFDIKLIEGGIFIDSATMNYAQNLESFLTSMINQNEIDTDELYKILPTTEGEFNVYFSCDYCHNKNVVKSWQILDNVFQQMALSDSATFLKYLNIADFVDGYYAEVYFDNLSTIIESNEPLFCDYYFKLSDERKKRLESYYSEFCNKN